MGDLPTMWPSGFSQTFAIIGAFIVFYVTVLTIHRLTFHPLAKYPGPFLSKISGFAVYLQTITGDRHLIHLEEHRKYGPIIRIAPNQLSFSDPSALRQIYQSSRQQNPLRKSPWYETIDAPSGAYSTHSEVSRTKHAFRRRVLDHAFSDSSLRSAETFVIENVDDFCDVVHRDTTQGKWSEPRNMSDLCTWLAYDIMGDLVFGKRFDCLTSPEHRYVPKLLMSSSAFVYPVAHLPFQSLVRPIISSPTLMSLFGGQLARDEHAYVSYANERVTERLASSKDISSSDNASAIKTRNDMMHHLINAVDPVTHRPFTRADLDAESSLLIAAGADTTSTTLAASFFYLTLPSSQPILTHLQSQLRSTYSSVNDIRSPPITKEVYLRAVIDEVLRLAPPVPTHLPRTVVSAEGLEVSGRLIPQGTVVGSAAYVLHHNETAFPDSFAFKPERWIPDAGADTETINDGTGHAAADGEDELEDSSNTVEQQNASPGSKAPQATPSSSSLRSPSQILLAKQAFTPFSLGSRGCVGKSLAYMELCICLGRVLWKYDIKRSESKSSKGDDDESMPLRAGRERRGWQVRNHEYQLYDCFLAEREGPWIEFRKWQRS